MKTFKKISSYTTTLFLTLILAYFVGMNFWPEQISEIAGYQFYSVVTNSMEPTIPTNSLVLTKLVNDKTNIKPDTIITFHADRFGDNLILTHYFRRAEVNDKGQTIYLTQAEGKDNYDAYETQRKDVIGTYVGHVPYVGKVFLYLQSTWGLITMGLIIMILIINRIISMRLDKAQEKDNEVVFRKKKRKRKEKASNQVDEGILIQSGDMLVLDTSMQLKGSVINQTNQTIYFLKVKIRFQNTDEKVIDSKLWYMVGREGLTPGEEKQWVCTLNRNDEIVKCQFEILGCKHSVRS